MPARLWYRVDLDALARAIDSSFVGCWDWNDQDRLFHLLGKPLVLYRSLADACGSVTSAILLSAFYNTCAGQNGRARWLLLVTLHLMLAPGNPSFQQL